MVWDIKTLWTNYLWLNLTAIFNTSRTILRNTHRSGQEALLFTDKEINFYMGRAMKQWKTTYNLFDKCFDIYEGKTFPEDTLRSGAVNLKINIQDPVEQTVRQQYNRIKWKQFTWLIRIIREKDLWQKS